MPKRKEIALDYRAWLFKARGNLGAAKRLAKDDDELLDHAIYHTQQCAETALKAFLAFRDIEIQKIHNLATLNKQCTSLDPLFESIRESLRIISPYVTQFRYPDDYLIPDREDVLEAITHAEIILTFVRRRIEYLSNPNMRIF